KPNFLFRTPVKDELSFAALEGGLVSSDPEDSAGLSPLCAAAQSDTELAAMLSQAASSIRL
ncbi:hypothetical protein M9458_007238, partial [Cirrhinus mrigala]